jgi:DNA polymerase III psi subunit
MDEWKRFANAAVQEELIAKTEALAAKYGFDKTEPIAPESLEKAARELHEIQERWKLAAEAPRAQAQALWHRYREAADPVQLRVREFFAHRAEERHVNLERKIALIGRAEQLADSTDWIRTAEELKKLQAEWQQIGPVPRQEMRTTWKRFRDACDTFFTRRNADLAQRKETWSENLAKKDALCVRAEALAASTEWDRAAAEVRQLQAEWKTIGPVRRNKSEAIWQRFRSACDTFFDRFKRRDQIELEAKQADREGLVVELETLAPEDGTSGPVEPAALLARVRELRNRWNHSTPVVRQGADPLSARFVGALERLLAAHPDAFHGSELDVESNRQRMEKLCARVEGFLSDAQAAPTSSQALANMLREALAANTIGGRAGEESKWKAMAEDVRQAQASWNRLGPVPGESGSQLADRFHRACSRFFDQYRRRVPQAPSQASRKREVVSR